MGCTELKKDQLYTYPSERINCPGVYSVNTIIKIVCKRNRELKNKTLFGVKYFICCYNQQMPFTKSNTEGRAPTNTDLSEQADRYTLQF